jgi:hypothetical protein
MMDLNHGISGVRNIVLCGFLQQNRLSQTSTRYFEQTCEISIAGVGTCLFFAKRRSWAGIDLNCFFACRTVDTMREMIIPLPAPRDARRIVCPMRN